MAAAGRHDHIHTNTWEQGAHGCATAISAEVQWAFPNSRFIKLNSVLLIYCLPGTADTFTRGYRIDLAYTQLRSGAKWFLGIFFFFKCNKIKICCCSQEKQQTIAYLHK